MEAPDYSGASALIGVTQDFVTLCEKRGVDLLKAWNAIGRTLNFFTEVRSPKSEPKASTSVKLTKDEATKATRLAREAKAKRLSMQPSEVNLTPEEAQQARENYRKTKTMSKSVVGSQPVPGPTLTLVASKPGKANTSNTSVTAQGARDTQKTRIETLKRNLKRQIPTSKEDPRFLHLVAYANSYSRLRSQWEDFKGKFDYSNMLNPLEKLPDPYSLRSVKLTDHTAGLKPQIDSPNTWILQEKEGQSFFDRDKPSKVCPERLAKPIPPEVLAELDPKWMEEYPAIFGHPYVF
jgi:hypothetical protein